MEPVNARVVMEVDIYGVKIQRGTECKGRTFVFRASDFICYFVMVSFAGVISSRIS